MISIRDRRPQTALQIVIDRVRQIRKAERHLQVDLVRVHLRFHAAGNRGEGEFAVVQLATESLEVFLLAIDGDAGDLVKLQREQKRQMKPAPRSIFLAIHTDLMCWCLGVSIGLLGRYRRCLAISDSRQLRDSRSRKELWNVELDETQRTAVRLSSA